MNLQSASNRFHPFSHADQAKSRSRHGFDVKSFSVVSNRECHAGRPARQVDRDVAGLAVLDGVPQSLLRDPEQAQRNLSIDIFRLNLVGKYLTYAFVALALFSAGATAAS